MGQLHQQHLLRIPFHDAPTLMETEALVAIPQLPLDDRARPHLKCNRGTMDLDATLRLIGGMVAIYMQQSGGDLPCEIAMTRRTALQLAKCSIHAYITRRAEYAYSLPFIIDHSILEADDTIIVRGKSWML